MPKYSDQNSKVIKKNEAKLDKASPAKKQGMINKLNKNRMPKAMAKAKMKKEAC